MPASADSASSSSGLLNLVERLGNRLPDPATLFLLGAVLVMILSHIAARQEWTVVERLPQPVKVEETDEQGQTQLVTQTDETGKPVVEWREVLDADGDPKEVRAQSLLTRDGFFWSIKNMVTNFMKFPPLGVVLVGMLGIGVAERTGLIAALLKAFMLVVPNAALTPAMVFLGIMSSMTLDAGYVVLPPLAAALYKSVGRSPIAGLAAVFAGVSAGFNANLFITGLEPMLAGFANLGGQVIDPGYVMNPACNWYFMIASTFLITLTGWAVTAWFVEPRFNSKPVDEGGPEPPSADDLAEQRLKAEEIRGLKITSVVFALTLGAFVAMTAIPGAPMYTYDMVDRENPKSRAVAELWYPSHDDREVRDYRLREVQLHRYDEASDEWSIFTFAAESTFEVIDGVVHLTSPSGSVDTMPLNTEIYFFRASRIEYDSPEGEIVVASTPEESSLSGTTVVVPSEAHFARWVDSIVPMLFICFVVPGIVYGVALRKIASDKDVAKLLIESMAYMAPIIVLAFFAAQFIEFFTYSNLGRMLAIWGGQTLGQAGLSTGVLIVAFILLTMVFNLFIGSMSAKYAMFAPIFIPMFMMVGISPELTQAAYRIGDSVTNIITPLNAYLIIILVFMQKFVPRGGMGTLIATMLPYTIAFSIVWIAFLILWMNMDWNLGPDGPLSYDPSLITGP